MNWIEENSSSIARYAYDPESYVLAVEFKNGGTYNYFDVPDAVFEQMQAAASKGQFLAQQIKGSYRYARA
jgi:hypothetical protein